MPIGLRILNLAAKVALDRVVGSSRAEEAIALLSDWWKGEDSTTRNLEVAEAKGIVSDTSKLQAVVAAAVAAQGASVNQGQIEAVMLSLISGFTELPGDLGIDGSAVEAIADSILPGSSKAYLVWLDHPAFDGPAHYVHLFWKKDAWRVRDFLGGKIFHPPGATANDKRLVPVAVDVTALGIWRASFGQVQSLKKCGLDFPTTAYEEWRQVLALLTCGAEAWRGGWPK